MKRHLALRPLSREHHLFLTWCRNARWFIEGSPRAPDLDTLLAELREQLPSIEAHFQVEEEVLFPFCEAALGIHIRPYTNSLRQGHDLWRRHITEVIGMARERPALLAQMARHLHDHIRFEERAVFPVLQDKLNEEQWRELRERLDG
jgi:iron-sulfur cluster repair protein YtfE (RIC family)